MCSAFRRPFDGPWLPSDGGNPAEPPIDPEPILWVGNSSRWDRLGRDDEVPVNLRGRPDHAGSSAVGVAGRPGANRTAWPHLPSTAKRPDTVIARELSLNIAGWASGSRFTPTAPGMFTLREFADKNVYEPEPQQRSGWSWSP